MSEKAAKSNEIIGKKRLETIVDFDPVRVSAPFSLRCGSLIVDYLIVILLPAIFLMISRSFGNDGSVLINSGLNDIGWFTGILIGFVSVILLPIATGRSIGKFATGIRVVAKDGSEASVGRMILRQILSIVLFPFTLGISFIWSAVSPETRTFHDYLAGTRVIYAKKSQT